MSKETRGRTILKSPLTLRNADPHQACFSIDDAAKSDLRSKSVMDFDRSVLPADYEPGLYNVTGEVVVTVNVTKRKG